MKRMNRNNKGAVKQKKKKSVKATASMVKKYNAITEILQ